MSELKDQVVTLAWVLVDSMHNSPTNEFVVMAHRGNSEKGDYLPISAVVERLREWIDHDPATAGEVMEYELRALTTPTEGDDG